MKYQKLVDELNNLLESTAKKQKKHHDTLQTFLDQFRSEEKKLRKRLSKTSDKASRKQLKKELNMVKKAYVILGT